MDFQSITFTEVSRHFGRRRVLNKINFQCRAREIVALVGANGAGKSTLLGIAATLLAPSSGRVQYGDAVPVSSADLRARIGEAGRRRVVERWSWKHCAQLTVDQYREVLAMPHNVDKLRQNGRL